MTGIKWNLSPVRALTRVGAAAAVGTFNFALMVACWAVGSHLTRATDNLSSTQFATHDAQDHANLPLISWHATPGDVIAFAGETVSDNHGRI
eukprot:COSAG02_NODE_23_length_52893_cov_58.101868_35_plen_92_part_00